MYIILLICGLVEWGFLGVYADGNCTQGCTVKQHLQCQLSVYEYECPMQSFDSLQPGKPTDLNHTLTYIVNPTRPTICDAAVNITWRVPGDASRLYVEGFKLELFYPIEPGISICVYYNLSEAHWTKDDVQIQYFYDCWTLRAGNYIIAVTSLPYNIHGSDTTVYSQLKVEQVYPNRHGVCPMPHTKAKTTAPEPTTYWPTPRPETSPHKLNVRLLLTVAGGCCVFVTLVVVVVIILWRRHTHPDVPEDLAPIVNHGVPSPRLNNYHSEHHYPAVIPPCGLEGSVSTEDFNNKAKEINSDDNFGAPRLLASENACSRFGDSICNDHSSELFCQGCGEPFDQQVDHNFACHGVVYGSGVGHYVGRPRVGYEGEARLGPDMGYGDEEDLGYFGGARRGPGVGCDGERLDYHHDNNSVDIDHQSVGGGDV